MPRGARGTSGTAQHRRWRQRSTRGGRLGERALTPGASSGRSLPTSGGGSAVVVVPDPEEHISDGSHLCHVVCLATSHSPFFNGGRIGSLSSSSPGSSSVPSFWRQHEGPSFSCSPSPRHCGGSSTPSSHSPRHRGGSSFSSSSVGIMRATAGSSYRSPIWGGSALAPSVSVTHEVQDVSSLDKCQGTATDGFFSS